MSMSRVLFIVLLLSFRLNAQDYKSVADADAVLQKVMQTSKTTQSISAKFTQEKYLSFLNQPAISKGVFLFKQPEQIRWEYQTPFKHIMIMANGKMLVKDENKTKETDIAKNVAAKELKKIINGMVSGQMLQNNKLFKTSVYENANGYKLVMEPKIQAMKNYITKIQHYFNKATLQTEKVEIFEKEGDKTIIRFSNVQVNAVVNDNVFKEL